MAVSRAHPRATVTRKVRRECGIVRKNMNYAVFIIVNKLIVPGGILANRLLSAGTTQYNPSEIWHLNRAVSLLFIQVLDKFHVLYL